MTDPATSPVATSSPSEPRPLVMHVTTVPMSLTFLRGQVSYMKRRGFNVVAISSPGSDLEAFGRDEAVSIAAVKMARRMTPVRDLRALSRLLSIFRRVRPTIVHAHTPKAGLLGMIGAALIRAPVRIYHMRGLPLMSATGWRGRLLWCTEWLACRLAHQVLCVSSSIRDEAIQRGLCSGSKIAVLANGSGNGVDGDRRFNPRRVDSEAPRRVRRRFNIPESAKVIGFVGRIVRDKGVVELAEAWKNLREGDPELHLLLVGPFESQDPIPARTAATLRKDPRVHFVGMNWNTPPLYASMDVVALPTHREGFPNVPLEAAAMELPIVATRIPGCVDAIEDGITGTLVPPHDPEALAAAIQGYLDDPGLGRRHGAAGRRRVLREYRQELVWEALYETYVRLLEASGRAVPKRSEKVDGLIA